MQVGPARSQIPIQAKLSPPEGVKHKNKFGPRVQAFLRYTLRYRCITDGAVRQSWALFSCSY